MAVQSSPTGSQCIPAVGCAEAGRYLVRMSCFVPNPKTGEPEIVAVNEKWLRITSKGTYAPDNQHH